MRLTRQWLLLGLVVALCWSAGGAVAEEVAEEPAAAPDPTDVEAHYAKGRALYQEGRFEEARAAFAAALRLRQPQMVVPAEVTAAPTDPSVPPPVMTDQARELYATGRSLYQENRFEEARAAFAEALQLQQGASTFVSADAVAAGGSARGSATVQVDIEVPVPESLRTSAALQQTHRQREGVLRQFTAADKALEQSRREVRALRQRVQQLPAQHKQRARTLERLAATEQAFLDRQARRQQLEVEVARLTERAATLWYNWGVEADVQGHTRDALARYRQVLELQPRHTDAQYNLATLLLKRRRIRQAEQLYRALLTVDPQDADAHYNLGLIAEEHRHAPQEALEHYRAYLELAPSEAPERGLVQGWVSVIEDQRREVEVE